MNFWPMYSMSTCGPNLNMYLYNFLSLATHSETGSSMKWSGAQDVCMKALIRRRIKALHIRGGQRSCSSHGCWGILPGLLEFLKEWHKAAFVFLEPLVWASRKGGLPGYLKINLTETNEVCTIWWLRDAFPLPKSNVIFPFLLGAFGLYCMHLWESWLMGIKTGLCFSFRSVLSALARRTHPW